MARARPVRNAVFGLRTLMRDPAVAVIAVLTGTEIGLATALYHWIEGWRWVDALYFSVVTIATVGYGDLTPATDAGKLFTVFYILTGIGLFVAFAAAVAETMIRNARSESPPEKDPVDG